MNTPLVSICTPTYNRVKLLERTIRSCLAQTYTNFEIVIADNSDNDASRDLVARLNDPRIRYVKNEKNLGFIGNIDKVVSLAKGKYIKVLMDDDLIMPQCLELSVAAFEKHPTVGVVMAPMSLIDENDTRIYPYFYLVRKMKYRYRFQSGDGLIPRRKILEEFLTHDYPHCVPSGLMYRTECFQKLGPFDFDAGFALDVEIAMRFAAHYDFYYIDQVLSAFRYSDVSLTSSMHAQGAKVGVFYYTTWKTLNDKDAMALFSPEERPKLIRDSIYFCSCRAFFLNLIASMKARKFGIMWDTIKLIFREDKFFFNKLRLPFFMVKELWVSFFPPKWPPARE